MPGVVGTSIPRVDAKSKVTGEALYASDYYLPGMLHLKLVRSTQAHAKISKIDIGAFTNLQDAYCFTAKDIEVNSFGPMGNDQSVLDARTGTGLLKTKTRGSATNVREDTQAAPGWPS